MSNKNGDLAALDTFNLLTHVHSIDSLRTCLRLPFRFAVNSQQSCEKRARWFAAHTPQSVNCLNHVDVASLDGQPSLPTSTVCAACLSGVVGEGLGELSLTQLCNSACNIVDELSLANAPAHQVKSCIVSNACFGSASGDGNTWMPIIQVIHYNNSQVPKPPTIPLGAIATTAVSTVYST